MQVNLITSPSMSARGLEQLPAALETKRPGDKAVFSQAEALNRALDAVSDTRTEEMLRARDLFNQVQYPPVQMIHRLSRLLAKEWSSAVE
jgi:hypothetical protein